mgnify:CR=1 FL=1
MRLSAFFSIQEIDIGADILQVKSEQLALDVLKHWDVTKV